MRKTAPPRGVLNPGKGRENFALNRFRAAADLSPFIEHFWSVAWDLTGKAPYVSETLPHPSVHVVFEGAASEIIGVMRGRFTRTLSGCGEVFGIKFTPGGFHTFSRAPVVGFTDTRRPARELFGEAWSELEQEISVACDLGTKVALAEKFLRMQQPVMSTEANLARQIVERIGADTTISKVDTVCEMFSLHKRQLQRLFSVYIGVSPKWVIERYRMHEAVERIPNENDMARLALTLGYFDQAHFSKAFRKLTGKSPFAYKAASL